MSRSWERLSARPLSSHRIFTLRAEQYRSPRTGNPVDVVVLEAPDWANVVALTEAGDVVLVRQFRFGTEETTLEVPGGMVDPGETPLAAAERELREETGYVAARWTSLGSVTPNPAFQRNRLHCFLAEGCELRHAQEPDPGEDLAVQRLPLSEVDAAIQRGEIDHALVVAAFYRFRLWQTQPQPG